MTIAVDLGRKATKQTNKHIKNGLLAKYIAYQKLKWSTLKALILSVVIKRLIWPRGYKLFFRLNLTEHEILIAHKKVKW